jgi:excisionase family DNA binding protein
MSTDTTNTQRLTISVIEAGEMLGIGRNKSYELAAQGVIPTLKLGKKLRVPIAALERMLDEAGSAA